MKNQYPGDVRDLFKYDLISHVIESMGNDYRFTFVPMLTHNDARHDGNRRKFDAARKQGRPGTKNMPLMEFLKPFHG
jgi:hypothetical protein